MVQALQGTAAPLTPSCGRASGPRNSRKTTKGRERPSCVSRSFALFVFRMAPDEHRIMAYLDSPPVQLDDLTALWDVRAQLDALLPPCWARRFEESGNGVRFAARSDA